MSRAEVPGRPLLEEWLKEVVENPIAPWEVQGIASSIPHDDREEEFVLSVDENGVPVWWPWKHPKTGEKLSAEKRRAWFLEWLGSVWEEGKKHVRFGSQGYRRRTLGIELLVLHADMTSGEQTWDEIGFDDPM